MIICSRKPLFSPLLTAFTKLSTTATTTLYFLTKLNKASRDKPLSISIVLNLGTASMTHLAVCVMTHTENSLNIKHRKMNVCF